MIDQHRKKVLILCTGNSCNSQIAEALINDRMPDTWEAYSAGTEPTGYINSWALKVLREEGIEHVGKSKHINDLPFKEFDLVFTVCDDAAKICPSWFTKGKCVCIRIPDPAGATGTKEEILMTFRIVRDEIEAQLLNYLKNLDKCKESILGENYEHSE